MGVPSVRCTDALIQYIYRTLYIHTCKNIYCVLVGRYTLFQIGITCNMFATAQNIKQSRDAKTNGRARSPTTELKAHPDRMY